MPRNLQRVPLPAELSRSLPSAGLWEPYQLAGTSDADVNRWGAATFDHFHALFRSPAAGAAGVARTTCFSLYTDTVTPRPPWADIVHNWRELSADACARMGHEGLAGGWAYEGYIADQARRRTLDCVAQRELCLISPCLLKPVVGGVLHCESFKRLQASVSRRGTNGAAFSLLQDYVSLPLAHVEPSVAARGSPYSNKQSSP